MATFKLIGNRIADIVEAKQPLLEHGYDQAAAVRDLLLSECFDEVHSRIDLGGHERITLGRRPC